MSGLALAAAGLWVGGVTLLAVAIFHAVATAGTIGSLWGRQFHTAEEDATLFKCAILACGCGAAGLIAIGAATEILG